MSGGYTSIADVRDYIVRSIDDILGSCDRLLQCVFGEHKVLDVTAEGARSIIYTRNNINRAVVLQITGDVWFPRDFHVRTAMNEAARMLPRTPFLSTLTSEIVAPPGVMIILNGNVEGFIFSDLFARRFSTDRLVFVVQDTERQHHEQQQA
ncbi:hypothetical protein POM88_004863 [Heracleum sosnowskyi]|uniref:Uncharacterized protein n=1 Tax=Heracleum sosnowskyi TaxID=360622 RepID=A0AAD8NES6_9APIA|nr:hypothetical protein POM88_004863 [Heracleum sosnowskyi]